MAVARVAVDSPVGPWVIEADEHVLTRVYLPLHHVAVTATRVSPALRDAARQLGEYFEGRRQTFNVDLRPTGTAFERDVWGALREIPFGEVRTYSDVAISIGRSLACRAVGNANGRNPYPVIVPCHRVVSSTGLGGYAGNSAAGAVIKRYLLGLERAPI